MVQRTFRFFEEFSHARSEREREEIDREIVSAGKQIDSLVYAIYGFSVEEIAVVENMLKKRVP